jgi:hypothetical protein
MTDRNIKEGENIDDIMSQVVFEYIPTTPKGKDEPLTPITAESNPSLIKNSLIASPKLNKTNLYVI